MISFRHDDFWFNYRAAAIITRPDTTGGNEILVTTETHLPFCYLPGGRVEMGEDAKAALVREIHEELGVPAEIGALLIVAETFHPHSDGSQGHNIELYFAVTLPEAKAVYEATDFFSGCDKELDLIFFWQKSDAAASDAAARPLVPYFLRDLLSQPLPPYPIHIVHREP